MYDIGRKESNEKEKKETQTEERLYLTLVYKTLVRGLSNSFENYVQILEEVKLSAICKVKMSFINKYAEERIDERDDTDLI